MSDLKRTNPIGYAGPITVSADPRERMKRHGLDNPTVPCAHCNADLSAKFYQEGAEVSAEVAAAEHEDDCPWLAANGFTKKKKSKAKLREPEPELETEETGE
jgi:hypothetical protein